MCKFLVCLYNVVIVVVIAFIEIMLHFGVVAVSTQEPFNFWFILHKKCKNKKEKKFIGHRHIICCQNLMEIMSI